MVPYDTVSTPAPTRPIWYSFQFPTPVATRLTLGCMGELPGRKQADCQPNNGTHSPFFDFVVDGLLHSPKRHASLAGWQVSSGASTRDLRCGLPSSQISRRSMHVSEELFLFGGATAWLPGSGYREPDWGIKHEPGVAKAAGSAVATPCS